MRFPQDVPVLSDGVVTLRAHRPADVELLYELALDPEALRWTSIPLNNTRADSQHFATEIMRIGWEQKNFRGWAIEATNDNGVATFAGNIDIRGMPIADAGFVLHPWARGRGLMRRALELAANWAFIEGGVEIIHWRSRIGNEASLRAAWAAGFTLDGVSPGLLYERGQVLDAWSAHLRFGDKPGAKTEWLDAPVIETDRFRMRPQLDKDAAGIVEACTDKRSQLWLGGLPKPYTSATAQAFRNTNIWNAANGTKISWIVADPDSDEVLGHLGIFGMTQLNPLNGEIGYWAHPAARGRGIMTEATQLAIAHAFGELSMRRLTLIAATGNSASNRIASNNGFTLIGTESQLDPLGDGTFADMNIYEFLASGSAPSSPISAPNPPM